MLDDDLKCKNWKKEYDTLLYKAFLKSDFDTMQALAKAIGKERKIVYRYLYGYIPKSVRTFFIICAALNVNPIQAFVDGMQRERMQRKEKQEIENDRTVHKRTYKRSGQDQNSGRNLHSSESEQ